MDTAAKIIPLDFSHPHLMSIADSAKLLGLKEYYLRKGIKEGEIPHCKVGVKFYIFIDEYIEKLHCTENQKS